MLSVSYVYQCIGVILCLHPRVRGAKFSDSYNLSYYLGIEKGKLWVYEIYSQQRSRLNGGGENLED